MTKNKNIKSPPRLWIKRVVLFESPDKKADPIRNITFHRGLNIVWGVELPDDAGLNGAHPVTLSGHSVGKTILCRLIRYCLGESTFGNPGVTNRIRRAFPNGLVGMELIVDGQEWTVRKPIGKYGDSRAAQTITVEELLLNQGHQENQYHNFMTHLEDAMMLGLQTNAHPSADKSYEWKHLLAWLSRDQESRFQSLHDWRSSRSGADRPKFHNPKGDPLYLMRLVLDLVQDNEIVLSQELAKNERELEHLNTYVEKLQREPEYRFNEQEKALKQLLDIPSNKTLNADRTNMISPVFIRHRKIEHDISKIKQDIEKIDRIIAEKREWISWNNEQQRKIQSASEITDEATEHPEAKEQEDDTIKRLRELRGKLCTFLNLDVKECQHYQDRLVEANNVADFQKARENKRVASETKSRQTILELQRKEHDEVVSLINDLRKKLELDKAEKNKKETELARYRDQLQRLDYHLKKRQEALDLIEGRMPNTKLQQETIRREELHKSIKQQKAKLKEILKLHKQQLQDIGEVYDSLIKHALSNTYSGALKMPNEEELQFHIEEVTGLSGEAVETLALVLADVAAMMCSCQGIGHHPRFLLHDSPREADLDRHIYNRYLQSMWTLTEDYGGISEAPFQYIVTTTSKPPDGLEKAICLRLEAHPESNMLLGRLLRNPPTQKQLALFGKKNSVH